MMTTTAAWASATVAMILLAVGPMSPWDTCRAAGPDAALADLVGSWDGALTYRDYQSGDRVSIPARLDNSMSDGGDVLISEIAFTDPGRVVRSLQMTTIKGDGSTVSSAELADGAFETETLEIESWKEDEGGWRMVLRGAGTDGGRSAEFRITRTFDGVRFVSTKEVRYADEPGAEWSFRNELSVARLGARRFGAGGRLDGRSPTHPGFRPVHSGVRGCGSGGQSRDVLLRDTRRERSRECGLGACRVRVFDQRWFGVVPHIRAIGG